MSSRSPLLTRLSSWTHAILRRSQMEREMDVELRFHVEARTEDLVHRGVPRQEALRRARIEFGPLESTKEECRESRGLNLLNSLIQDLRFALRMLRKSPGFTLAAVLTLALGIGVNAAVFGLVDAALLSALPFHEPERLAHIWSTDAGGDLHTPLPAQYVALRRFSRAFEQVAGTGWVDNFYGSDETGWQSLPGIVVSSNWLPTLGVQPLLGRNFFDDEETAGHDRVVMLSYSCWRTRFHADPRILGRQIVLNRRAVAVIAVLPQSLGTYYQNEIVAPLVLDSYLSTGKARVAGTVRIRIVGRLKPGVTLEQAQTETETIAAGLRSPAAPRDRGGHFVVEDFREMLRNPGPTLQNARRGLWLMAAAAAVVLLISCANVASLLLARGVKRQREVALRSALGSSRTRLIRQLLTESTLLFLCGAGLGLIAARWSQEVITKAVSGMISNSAYLEVNSRVFVGGLLICLICALFFGMIPALHTTRVNLTDNLKDATVHASSGPGARRPRNFLVVFQIALGMVLLVGFGLLFRSLLHVEAAPFGFDPQNVLTATVNLPVSRYAGLSARARLMHAAIERVRAMPGVESAGAVDTLPMDGADSARLTLETPSSKTAELPEEIYFVSVGSDYFSTLKIPMLNGRPFDELDTQSGKPVAIINGTFAEQFFPGANPVGFHLAFADSPTTWRQIVGVVSDFRQRNPEEDVRPLVYLPVAQTLPGRWSMVIRIRAAEDFAAITKSVRDWLRGVDSQLYWEMGSMDLQIANSESLTLRRPIITLSACFGGLALVLIIIGVFGVTSYSVAERTREIGIRVSLGAARTNILRLVLLESLGVALAGLALGTFGALALTRVLPVGQIGWSGSGIFLYNVSRADPVTYLFAVALLLAVVLAASGIPACRATRVDPLVALRHE
jgi:putative ABC transport system permease protein